MRFTHSGPAPTERNDAKTLKTLLPYLLEFKGRVALALSLLMLAKLANVSVPWFLKDIVDQLSATQAALAMPLGLVAAYGLARLATSVFGELRDAVFAKVTQRAIRRIALQVFEHLHRLSLRFHLERQTGGMSRDIERGTKGIGFLLNFTLFNILPTLLEIALVAGILLHMAASLLCLFAPNIEVLGVARALQGVGAAAASVVAIAVVSDLFDAMDIKARAEAYQNLFATAK